MNGGGIEGREERDRPGGRKGGRKEDKRGNVAKVRIILCITILRSSS